MTLIEGWREDLDRFINEHYVEPKSEWPARWWEPGAEDAPEMLPEDQWLPDDEELPFE